MGLRHKQPDREAARQAVRALVEALGYEVRGELTRTPERVADLWIDRLTSGEARSLEDVVRAGTCEAAAEQPVSMLDMGVHMICPHHLTISQGRAHVAYAPRGSVLGFGAMTELVETATARLVLQEDATRDIAEALVAHLGAAAAVACIQASHPCQTVSHPRSHEARAVTWAASGEARAHESLRTLLLAALADRAPRT